MWGNPNLYSGPAGGESRQRGKKANPSLEKNLRADCIGVNRMKKMTHGTSINKWFYMK